MMANYLGQDIDKGDRASYMNKPIFVLSLRQWHMSPYNLSLKVTSPRFSSVLGGQCSASIDLLICLKKTVHCLGIFIYNLVGSRGTK